MIMDKLFIKNRYSTIRNSHNISARKLSLELGQSSEYINQIENGKNLPSIEGLLNFCEYFHISVSEFFEENFKYPIEYKEIISNLNKLDSQELSIVSNLIELISSNKSAK